MSKSHLHATITLLENYERKPQPEYAAIDATIVRAHQHSACAKNSHADSAALGASAIAEDIGRSQGGLSTKIHAVVDALGNLISFF